MRRHPAGHTDLKTALALLGGPALFLLGSLLFKLSIWKRWAMSRIVGLGAARVAGRRWSDRCRR